VQVVLECRSCAAEQRVVATAQRRSPGLCTRQAPPKGRKTRRKTRETAPLNYTELSARSSAISSQRSAKSKGKKPRLNADSRQPMAESFVSRRSAPQRWHCRWYQRRRRDALLLLRPAGPKRSPHVATHRCRAIRAHRPCTSTTVHQR